MLFLAWKKEKKRQGFTHSYRLGEEKKGLGGENMKKRGTKTLATA